MWDDQEDLSHLSMEEISIAHCARCLCRLKDDADRVEIISRGAGTVRALCVECYCEIGEDWPWDPRNTDELWDRPEEVLPQDLIDRADWWKRGQGGGEAPWEEGRA